MRAGSYICLQHGRLFFLGRNLLPQNWDVSSVVHVVSIKRLEFRLQCFNLGVSLSQCHTQFFHLHADHVAFTGKTNACWMSGVVTKWGSDRATDKLRVWKPHPTSKWMFPLHCKHSIPMHTPVHIPKASPFCRSHRNPTTICLEILLTE